MKIELEWYEAEMAAKVGMARDSLVLEQNMTPISMVLKKGSLGFSRWISGERLQSVQSLKA